jgi:hypothetical protein
MFSLVNMRKIWALALSLLLIFFSFKGVYSQSFDTDIAGFGFTTGIAAKEIAAGQAAQVSNHNLKVDIPQGAFSSTITFEILQGQNSYFQSETPTGRIIITNFAFRIRNHTTNKLIADFKRPVLVTVILPDDATDVEVWKVELTHPPRIVSNKGKSEIGDKTLMLQADSATTGWIITSSTENTENSEGEALEEESFPEEDIVLEAEESNPSTASLVLPIIGVVAIGAVLIYLIRK